MFTHIIQLFLVISTISLVVYALRTYVLDNQEAKEVQRHHVAFTHANMVVNDRLLKGRYDNTGLRELKNDFDAEYNAYRAYHK